MVGSILPAYRKFRLARQDLLNPGSGLFGRFEKPWSGSASTFTEADVGLDGSCYRQALENFARQEEVHASHLASLADELERRGQSRFAAMLRQASHRYKISSTRNRTFAMAPDQATWPS
jgi:hypothetical protein